MANKQVYTNNATAALNSAITAATTSIVLQSGQGSLFPSPSGGDWFLATIYDGASTIEIVKCTARTTDTLTVTRAQEGTTAAAFSAGSSFEMAVTKGTLEQFVQRTGDTVSVAMGGTGATTLTANNVILGNGTSAVAFVAPGSSNNILTSNGTTWTSAAPSSLGATALLATLTPTASANVDALSTFTSSYDAYLIVLDGIKPATDDTLSFRFANGGSADTGSNYFAPTVNGSSTTALTAGIVSNGVVTSAGKGFSGEMKVLNANDATNLKLGAVQGAAQTAATPGFADSTRTTSYNPANAISGIRFYWSGGANFSATGKIYIYGLKNT